MSLRIFLPPMAPIAQGRICVYCKKLKPLSAYPGHRGRTLDKDSRCRECKRARDRVVKRLRKTAPKKSLVCECCGNPPASNATLVIDHDPKTEKFRGWLCKMCNTSLGGLGDSVEGLENALRYLQRHTSINSSDKEECSN